MAWTRRSFVGVVAAFVASGASRPRSKVRTEATIPRGAAGEVSSLTLGELFVWENISGDHVTVRCSVSDVDCVLGSGERWFWIANQVGSFTFTVTSNSTTHRRRLDVIAQTTLG